MINKKTFFIGVDGGGSKCHVRIEDGLGHLLGEGMGGPANIRLSKNQAWDSIFSVINEILTSKNLKLADRENQFYAGMGLAGCEVKEAYQAFCAKPHPFKKLLVTSDSYTACLGAHDGLDGAIIIAGTGVVGLQIEKNEMTKVGGFGFPHDDKGGGAWLGLQAVRATLQWCDKRLASSSLAEAIYAHFGCDLDALVQWAHAANSTQFASLAPFVIQHSQTHDAIAIQMMQKAADAINTIGDTLLRLQKDQQRILQCALIGGITEFLKPYLNHTLQHRICIAKKSPASGAIQFIRTAVAKEEHDGG